MKPKFAIITVGKSTNVFLDGKSIGQGILDLHYHAKDENGNFNPTVDMKINVNGFSFDDGCTIEEFFQQIEELNKNFAEGDRKRAARLND